MASAIRSRLSIAALSRTRPVPATRVVPFRPFPYQFASIHSVPKLNDPSLLISQVLVNGEFVGAASGETFEVHDPSTGKKIADCAEFNKQDTEKAITAAQEAFKTWKKTTGRERATLLRKWYDLMQENAADIATLITWEVSFDREWIYQLQC